jgi:PST family polysaccharide transporter
MSDLAARISRASMAQGTTTLLGKAANMLLGIVLARLLYPEDYGLFTITLIITGLANMVSNFGFQSYIIQAEELTQTSLNTCYTLNVLFSLALGLVVAAIGWLWPHPPAMLPEMLAMYGLLVFLSGLSYIELALLKRELEFSKSSRVDLTFTVVSMGGRVAFAAAHLGALCFPLGDVLGGLVRWLMVRRMSHTPLRMAKPDRAESREALWFGMHSTSIGVASFVANQIDKMLVALNYPIASIGLYGFGNNTASMFYNAFIVPQTGVFLATFARLRGDLAQARRTLNASSRLIFTFSLPVQLALLLDTDRVVAAVFTAKWLAAAPLVRIFALDYLQRSMFSGITGIQLSFGLAGRAARTKWIGASFFIVSLLVATLLHASILQYAIAYLVASIAGSALNVIVNGRVLVLHWGEYFRNLLPPAVVGVLTALPFAWVVASTGSLGLWRAVAVDLSVLAGLYAVLTLVLNRAPLLQLLSLRRNISRPGSSI